MPSSTPPSTPPSDLRPLVRLLGGLYTTYTAALGLWTRAGGAPSTFVWEGESEPEALWATLLSKHTSRLGGLARVVKADHGPHPALETWLRAPVAPPEAGRVEAAPANAFKSSVDATAERIIKRCKKRKPILWVGAGTSIGAGLPSTSQLLGHLAEAIDDVDLDISQPFPKVVDDFVHEMGQGELRRVLQEAFKTPGALTPTLRGLAEAAGAGYFKAIVTTNFDDLLERALGEARVPYLPQTLEGNLTLPDDGSLRLLKLHGSRDDWERIIFSGDAYTAFGRTYPLLQDQLHLLLLQHPILFVGCSMQDPRILDWLAALPEPRAVQLHPWAALITEGGWSAALAHAWEGGQTEVPCSHLNLGPTTLKNLVESVSDLPTML